MTNNELALMANIAVDMQKNEVNAVLDKIRAEIEKVMVGESLFDTENAKAQYNALSWCVEIIDKYKAESEE